MTPGEPLPSELACAAGDDRAVRDAHQPDVLLVATASCNTDTKRPPQALAPLMFASLAALASC